MPPVLAQAAIQLEGGATSWRLRTISAVTIASDVAHLRIIHNGSEKISLPILVFRYCFDDKASGQGGGCSRIADRAAASAQNNIEGDLRVGPICVSCLMPEAALR